MYQLEELAAWKSARKLRVSISKLSKGFPESEKYKLTDQIVRSSRSVSANIAEGYRRYYYKENIQFCRIARGSLLETLDHLYCSLDENFITEKEFREYKDEFHACLKILNGYISYLKQKKDYINNYLHYSLNKIS